MSGISEVCRLCMKKSRLPGQMKNIFSGEAVTVETIRTVTQIEVVMGDGLPPNVCQSCISKLNSARNFIQSCIECNEKLKLEFTVSASKSTASNIINSLSPTSTPAAVFPGQLKTETSLPYLSEYPNRVTAHETDDQNVDPLTVEEDTDQFDLKYEMFDETDVADICRPGLDNENSEMEPVVKSDPLTVTQEAGSSLLVELSRESFGLQIKREQIAVHEEFDDQLLLPTEAEEPIILNLQESDYDVTTAQEMNKIGWGEVVPAFMEAIPPLNMVSASCQEPNSSENSAIPELHNIRSTETVTAKIHARNTVENEIESPILMPRVLPRASSSRVSAGTKSILLRLTQQRKRGVQCHKCCRIFPRLSLLRQHACDSTESSNVFDFSRMFECSHCLAGFSSTTSLEIHQKQHLGNRFCYKKPGPNSQASDFDINSSDSETSVFELNIPDSEGSNQDLKSSDSEGSKMGAHLDSEEPDFFPSSDSDSCEMDKSSFETDVSVLRSNSDSDGSDIDTSLESEGSGLRPNSDSERSCRNTSTESDGSVMKSQAEEPEADVETTGCSFVDSAQGTMTSCQNSEFQVRMPTSSQNTSQHELINKGGHLLGSSSSPSFLAEKPTTGSASGSSALIDNSSVTGNESRTENLDSLNPGGGNSPAERCIKREDDRCHQQRKKSRRVWEGEYLPSAKRRCIGSKSESQETSKGVMPCVQPGEICGVLASVGPVCKRTRSQILPENTCNISCKMGLNSRLGFVNISAKNDIFRKKKIGDSNKLREKVKSTSTSRKENRVDVLNHKDREMLVGSVMENQKPNYVSLDSEVTNEMEELGHEKTKHREKGKLKQNIGLVLKGTDIIKKTGEQKTTGKGVIGNVAVKSVKESGKNAKTGGIKENGTSSKISFHLSHTKVRGPKNLGKGRRSMHSAVPYSAFQCWECGREFKMSAQLIIHFRGHLRAMLQPIMF